LGELDNPVLAKQPGEDLPVRLDVQDNRVLATRLEEVHRVRSDVLAIQVRQTLDQPDHH
jgi:hypothetical protein